VIKLKTLILEGPRPTISKQEEAYALKVIISKLLPGVVNLYNWSASTKWHVPQITLDDARKELKKFRVENFTNGQAIEYGIKLPGTTISFKTQKLNHGRKALENEDIIAFEVGYYNFSITGWGDLNWNIFDVEGLAKGNYDTDKGDYDVDPVHFMSK